MRALSLLRLTPRGSLGVAALKHTAAGFHSTWEGYAFGFLFSIIHLDVS